MTSPERDGSDRSGGPSVASGPGARPGTVVSPHDATVPGLMSTAGVVDPDAAPAVSHGWAAALTHRCAHYVPPGAERDVWFGREVGLTLDGWFALIDEQGLRDGAEMRRCLTCRDKLALIAGRERQ